MKGWENQYRKARLNTISWDFPRREIILGVLQMPCTSQKPKPEPRNSPRNWEEKRRPKKTNRTLAFSTHKSSLEVILKCKSNQNRCKRFKTTKTRYSKITVWYRKIYQSLQFIKMCGRYRGMCHGHCPQETMMSLDLAPTPQVLSSQDCYIYILFYNDTLLYYQHLI